jgi:hypothetical protein
LIQLRDLLAKTGWRILPSQGDDSTRPDCLFSVEDENIVWKLVNREKNLDLQLAFLVRGNFGEASQDLTDIQFGEVAGHDMKLWFPGKRNRKLWQRRMEEFTNALNRLKS